MCKTFRDPPTAHAIASTAQEPYLRDGEVIHKLEGLHSLKSSLIFVCISEVAREGIAEVCIGPKGQEQISLERERRGFEAKKRGRVTSQFGVTVTGARVTIRHEQISTRRMGVLGREGTGND